jgi:hypothetical protein
MKTENANAITRGKEGTQWIAYRPTPREIKSVSYRVVNFVGYRKGLVHQDPKHKRRL